MAKNTCIISNRNRATTASLHKSYNHYRSLLPIAYRLVFHILRRRTQPNINIKQPPAYARKPKAEHIAGGKRPYAPPRIGRFARRIGGNAADSLRHRNQTRLCPVSCSDLYCRRSRWGIPDNWS